MTARFALPWAILALAIAASCADAQDDATEDIPPGPWKQQAELGLNLSQSSFSDNWSGGDKGSINWVLNADYKADRQVNEVLNLSNLLQLAYGQTSKQEFAEDGARRWSRPDKTTDLIQLESTARFDFQLWVEPYASFRFDSQFSDESDPIGRLMFNPLKFSETGGVARVFDKAEDREFIARAGFGFRQVVAQSFVGGDPDETERFTTRDGGFEFQSTAAYPLWDGAVAYKGKFLLFLPVFFNESDALKEFDSLALASDPGREEVQDFWKTPDINFQNTFTAQITKYLSVNLYLQFVYDKFDQATNVDPDKDIDDLIAEVDGGIRKAGQFKQTLALGITYRLF